MAGVEKMADHGTNGPRNFCQVSRKNEKEKGNGIDLEKSKMKSLFFVKIIKAVLIDSHY